MTMCSHIQICNRVTLNARIDEPWYTNWCRSWYKCASKHDPHAYLIPYVIMLSSTHPQPNENPLDLWSEQRNPTINPASTVDNVAYQATSHIKPHPTRVAHDPRDHHLKKNMWRASIPPCSCMSKTTISSTTRMHWIWYTSSSVIVFSLIAK